MVFYAFASTLVVWVVWGYRMAFSEHMIPGLVGKPGPVLSSHTELSATILPEAAITANFPKATMIYFQFVFAAITVILMAGAFLCRMNFRAWMIFCPLWITFSYTVGAFSLWGGGWGFQRGIIDYSGGYVIHVSSGTAGFVGAWWIGPRLKQDRENFKPHNILLALVGCGILWIGWNGFNGGDPYAASPDAGAAVLNTNLATAVSLLTWTSLDIIFFKKPAVIGAVQGMITGLVAITPAAGVVAGWGAIIIGVCSGSIPWVTMNILGTRLKFFTAVDDTLGVVHTHLVAGVVGGFLVGIFATAEGCAAFALLTPGGAIEGNGKQIGWQLAGALFIIGWNVVWTSLIMAFIKYVCRVPLRMSDEDCLIGDDAIHGEAAYTFGEGVEVSTLHGENVRSDVEMGQGPSSSPGELVAHTESKEIKQS